MERSHDELRRAVSAVEPNAAHRGLAAYQAEHPKTHLFTQNVDGLLRRAGATSVVELHGSLFRARCLGHAHRRALFEDFDPAARCTTCGSRLRTDVVLFEERAPEYQTLWTALSRARAADALVVIGTEGTVLPITELARQFPGRTLFNNLRPSPAIDEATFDVVLHQAAADAIHSVLATLEKWRADLA